MQCHDWCACATEVDMEIEIRNNRCYCVSVLLKHEKSAVGNSKHACTADTENRNGATKEK